MDENRDGWDMPMPAENPFAVSARRSPRVSVRRWLSASKGLGLVSLLLVGIIIAQTQTRRWLLDRWATGLSDLPPAEQVSRLLQIDALGDIAIETIAKRLVAEDQTVAAAAYQLLRDHQAEWTTREAAAMARAHQHLLNGLAAVAPELHGERRIWAKELVNQSILEFVDHQSTETQVAYELATRTLQLIHGQAGDATATEESAVATAGGTLPQMDAGTLAAQSRGLADSGLGDVPQLVPLPIKLRDATALAPLEPTAVPVKPTSEIAETNVAGLAGPTEGVMPSEMPVIVAPKVTQLTPTEPEPGQVHAVTQNGAIASTPAPLSPAQPLSPRDELQPVRTVTQNSLESYSTKSVIDLLGSAHAATRDDAVSELVRRGMTNEEIRSLINWHRRWLK